MSSALLLHPKEQHLNTTKKKQLCGLGTWSCVFLKRLFSTTLGTASRFSSITFKKKGGQNRTRQYEKRQGSLRVERERGSRPVSARDCKMESRTLVLDSMMGSQASALSIYI